MLFVRGTRRRAPPIPSRAYIPKNFIKPDDLVGIRQNPPRTFVELTALGERLNLKIGHILNQLVREGIVERKTFYPPLSRAERDRRARELLTIFDDYFEGFFDEMMRKRIVTPREKSDLREICVGKAMASIDRWNPNGKASFRTYVIKLWHFTGLDFMKGKMTIEKKKTKSDTNREGESISFPAIDYKRWKLGKKNELSYDQEIVLSKAERIIEDLNPKERVVVLRHFGLQGFAPMNNAEIAREMTLSPNTVKAIVMRFIRRVREKTGVS